MRRIGCLFGFHNRSREDARSDEGRYVSVCQHCRVPMYRSRDAKRSWKVLRP